MLSDDGKLAFLALGCFAKIASGSKQLAGHRFDDEKCLFGDPGRLLGDLGVEMAPRASF